MENEFMEESSWSALSTKDSDRDTVKIFFPLRPSKNYCTSYHSPSLAQVMISHKQQSRIGAKTSPLDKQTSERGPTAVELEFIPKASDMGKGLCVCWGERARDRGGGGLLPEGLERWRQKYTVRVCFSQIPFDIDALSRLVSMKKIFLLD